MTKSAGNCEVITFTEEILNGQLHFLCNDNFNFNDDDNFDGYDSETVNHARFIAWQNIFKDGKECKKASKELIHVGWHIGRWWDWQISEDEKYK